MKSADETAREMIVRVDYEERYGWFAAVQDGDNWRPIECLVDSEDASEEQARADAVDWLAGVIAAARYDGAVEALLEVASRLDPLAREAREISASHHDRDDGEGAALEGGKAAAYHHAAHLARELVSRPRKP